MPGGHWVVVTLPHRCLSLFVVTAHLLVVINVVVTAEVVTIKDRWPATASLSPTAGGGGDAL
jgi:hypothetical protein